MSSRIPRTCATCAATPAATVCCFFSAGSRVFFTDGRYTEQAREEVQGARIVIAKGPLLNEAVKLFGRPKSADLGFEADHTTVVAAADMRKLVHKKITWKPTSGLIMRQRMRKDADELRIIREAVKMGASVYEQALPSIRPGVRGVRGRRQVGVCRARGRR